MVNCDKWRGEECRSVLWPKKLSLSFSLRKQKILAQTVLSGRGGVLFFNWSESLPDPAGPTELVYKGSLGFLQLGVKRFPLLVWNARLTEDKSASIPTPVSARVHPENGSHVHEFPWLREESFFSLFFFNFFFKISVSGHQSSGVPGWSLAASPAKHISYILHFPLLFFLFIYQSIYPENVPPEETEAFEALCCCHERSTLFFYWKYLHLCCHLLVWQCHIGTKTESDKSYHRAVLCQAWKASTDRGCRTRQETLRAT